MPGGNRIRDAGAWVDTMAKKKRCGQDRSSLVGLFVGGFHFVEGDEGLSWWH
jgi:hypothetical protein